MNRLFRFSRLSYFLTPFETGSIWKQTYCSSIPARPFILGIETSCDETGAAVVDDRGNVLGEGLFSQQTYSSRFGGVIPSFAQSLHEQHVGHVVEQAMTSSGLRYEDLDAVAVTTRPGLVLCLRAGANHALELCRKYRKPLLPIHHMQAHALTIRMNDAIDRQKDQPVEYPFLCLLVSGGHCILTLVKSVDEFLVVGQAIDGAPGEAFDKVARRLKIRHLKSEYDQLSGGALMERVAREGNPLAISFPNPRTGSRENDHYINFSFSGLKSYAFEVIEDMEKEHGDSSGDLQSKLPDFCASFQHAVCKHMGRRLERALRFLRHSQLAPPGQQSYLVVSGGVASNSYLRAGLSYVAAHFDYRLISPPPRLCTDNGIMIAWNAVERFKAGLGIIPPQDLPTTLWVDAKSQIGQAISTDYILNARKESKLMNSHIKLSLNFYDPSHLAEAIHYSDARLKRRENDHIGGKITQQGM